ncbi:MAG: GldG family protein [Clostridiales bacterium]|jgi:ABC-2 type transport system permease protein|nr:GldG family protein [Clostridiales bacterium]
MDAFIKSFTNKKVKYGSFSTLMIILLIAIVIIINLVVEQLNLSFDMTASKNFSISDDTKEIIKNLKEDVTIYALVRTGEEANMFADYVGQLTFKRLLEEYANNSSHIKVEYKDPYLYPQFVDQYAENGEQVSTNSLIVVGPRRNKIIASSEVVTLDYDMTTYQQYVSSIDIEPRVTNAINYVTSENTSTVYTVSGNDDVLLQDSLKSQISQANFDVKDVNLVTSDIPEDCTILFVTQPMRDWTSDEAEKVSAFLQNDGKAVFALGYVGIDYPNLGAVLQAYGVGIGKYIVIEGSANHYVLNNPLYIIPEIQTHDITASIQTRSLRPLVVQGSGIEELAVKKTSTKIEPLLVTSTQAYGKTDMSSTTMSKEAGDASGPFNMAVAVTDSFYTDVQHTTKLIVIGASSFIDENINAALGGPNWTMLIDSMNWLQDKNDTIYIPSKTPDNTARLSITSMQIAVYTLFSIIILPVLILAFGLAVWLRRRHS